MLVTECILLHAMRAWYILSSCVCLSLSHKSEFY